VAGLDQNLLKIGAVDHQIGCAVAALCDISPSGRWPALCAAAIANGDALRLYGMDAERFVQAERLQISMALGESWMPAPTSSNCSAFS
jgi:hypothetical protein